MNNLQPAQSDDALNFAISMLLGVRRQKLAIEATDRGEEVPLRVRVGVKQCALQGQDEDAPPA